MKVIVSKVVHENQDRISVKNEGFDGSFPARMKQITGARWSPEQRCWHIPHTPESREKLKALFPDYEIAPANF